MESINQLQCQPSLAGRIRRPLLAGSKLVLLDIDATLNLSEDAAWRAVNSQELPHLGPDVQTILGLGTSHGSQAPQPGLHSLG